jgi:predicted heme/steroid binding protein
MGNHQARKDITKEVEIAPHGKEVLERNTVMLVGRLI